MPLKLILSLAAAALAGWLLALPLQSSLGREARAGTAERLDIEARVAASKLVLLGDVRAARTFQTPAGRILTEYDLIVERTYWGQEAPYRSVRLPGGVLADGSGMLISGVPQLKVGEQVFLFLTGADDDQMRMPVGLSQGHLRVVPNPEGGRSVIGWTRSTSLVDEHGQLQRDAAVGVGSLAELSALVQASVQARRAAGELPK